MTMRALWKATATVIENENLRAAISAAAKTTEVPQLDNAFNPSLAPDTLKRLSVLNKQPDPAAIAAIDTELRAAGLHLSAYELCELNRWFDKDKTDAVFSRALGQARIEFQDSLQLGASSQSQGFHEALGALIADPEFRGAFALSTDHLHDHGFDITKEEEDMLRAQVTPGSGGDTAAQALFDLGWSGTACMANLRFWPRGIHSNR
jgi:hypothetical protein